MGARVLGLMGSPRIGGNSDTLLDAALAGAKEAGAEVEKLVLGHLNASPCLNCDDCLLSGQCTTYDDMQWVYPKLRGSDAIILASPVFFLTVSAQTKLVMDRCQCLWVTKHVLKLPVGQTGRQRRGLFISVAHSPRPSIFEGATLVARAWFNTLEVEYAGELLFGGVESAGEIVTVHPEATAQAFAAGARLVDGL